MTRQAHIDIDAPPDAVWEALVDLPSYEADAWNDYIRSIDAKLVPGATVRAQTFTREMGERALKAKMVGASYPELSWEKKSPLPGLIHAFHWFRVEPQPHRRSRLIQGERLSGALAPLFFPLVKKSESGFESFNRALKRRVETAARP